MQVPLRGAYTQEQYTRSTTSDMLGMQWSISDGAEKAEFSAVGWHFGRVVREKLGIPVGVIQVAVGGSSMAEWIRLDTLKGDLRLAQLAESWPNDPMVSNGHQARFEENFQELIQAGKYVKYTGPTRHHTEPSVLFDAGIRPLQKVAFKGVIWYQGESNSRRPEDFYVLFPMLVSDWRDFFGQGDFPFYFVQLPSFERETWPEVREIQQQLAATIQNSEMVVTIDLGLEENIHPDDKQPVGERLARLALNESYDTDTAWESPVPISHQAIDGGLLLSYEHVGEGLKSVNQQVPGFEGEDCAGVYHPLQAEIIAKDSIMLTTITGSLKTIRYAYKPYARPIVKLWSSDGLPAAPFAMQVGDCDTMIQTGSVNDR